jgi:hypothetical protein
MLKRLAKWLPARVVRFLDSFLLLGSAVLVLILVVVSGKVIESNPRWILQGLAVVVVGLLITFILRRVLPRSIYTPDSLKAMSERSLDGLFKKHPRLFREAYRSSIRDDPKIALAAILSASNNYCFASSRLRSDVNFALLSIEASPDVIAHFPSAILNDSAISELLNSKEFVLEVLDPEEYGSDKYDWSGNLSPDWRRLNYLAEHWRSDKEMMLLAIRCECQILSDKRTQESDRGKEDWYMIAAPMLFGDFESLFAIASDSLMRNPDFLAEVEDYMTSFFDDTMEGHIEGYLDQLDHMEMVDETNYQLASNLRWTSIEGLHETSELLINGLDGFWDPLSPPVKRAANPVPDRLLQAVKNSRGVIDFYRAVITDESDKENIKTAFHDALKALSATPTDYDKDPVKFCFESGIGDLCDLIPDELLNDPKMLFEFEQALIATLVPHILDGTYPWQDTDWFQYFLEEQELDEFPSPDSLANLTCYLDAMEDDTVSPPDYDNSRALSHPIPDRLVNAVSNAREEIDALAAEKEQQRLRKTLVDELSNLRNSRTA